jgi:hypothetical protein
MKLAEAKAEPPNNQTRSSIVKTALTPSASGKTTSQIFFFGKYRLSTLQT